MTEMSQLRKAPEGILGFPVAPFNKEGKLEEEALYENIRFYWMKGLRRFYRLRLRRISVSQRKGI